MRRRFEKPFNFRLPQDVLEAIDREVERTGETRSEVVRRLLREALSKPERKRARA